METSSENPRPKRRACARCANAKAKCNFIAGRNGCERCIRLRKDCVVEDEHRRRKRKHAKVEALEEKVDGLLALLGPDPGRAHSGMNLATPAATDAGESSVKGQDTQQPKAINTTGTSPSSIEDGHFDVIDRGLLTLEAADVLLERFKTVLTPTFPFVVIPPETDAATLRRQLPFLFLTIVTACLEEDHTLQRSLGFEIKKVIAQRIVLDNERSLELLQGLIVHVCWYFYHFKPGVKGMYLLMQMAVVLVIDLDLDRCPIHHDQRIGGDICIKIGTLGGTDTENKCRRTPAEHRALLGCYYLSLTMSIMRKELAMKHNAWVDHCCNVLTAEMESPTDLSLKGLIQARSLARRISDVFSYDDPTSVSTQNVNLLDMSIKNFQQDLKRIESIVPSPAREENYAFMLELKALAVVIHEVALYQERTQPPTLSSLHNSHLWSLLTSGLALIRYVFEIPNEKLKRLPSASFHLLWYGVVVLSTLVRLPSAPGWDSAAAKKEVDLMKLGQDLKEKFENTVSRTGQNVRHGEKDVWAYFSRGIGGMLAWHMKQEMQADGETGWEIRMNSHNGIVGYRCGVSDVMTSLVESQGTRPPPKGVNNDQQNQQLPNGTSQGTDRAVWPDESSPPDFWDDTVWQSLLDEFSLFPGAPSAGYQAGSFT